LYPFEVQYAFRRPSGPLADFVEQIWFFEGYVRPHAKERLLPDGSSELIIHLSEDEIRVWDPLDTTYCERLDGAVLIGPQSRYFVIDTAEQQSVMGVHFRPGGAFPFVRLPLDELHGLHVSLRDLWGGFARDLREQILALGSTEARFDLLEEALLARMLRPESCHDAVRHALWRFRDQRRVAEVVDETGLSQRRFIELFRRQVGLPPKMYCRVRRFQRVVRGLPLGRPIDWAETALDAGYSDQAHLIHDFRSISGISPGTWAAIRTEHTNHVPLAG
jgi:AraC-like DNA-binding protein